MPLQKQIRDLMVPLHEYSTTTLGKTLKEAIPVLRKLYCQIEEGRCTQAGHRNILVLDQSGRLVGILNFRSILAVLIPEVAGSLTERLESLGISIAFAQADYANLDEARASFPARVIRNADTKVEDVMLKIRGTINIDEDLMDALKLMYRNKITVLPVYDREKLVGVLRESDLFLTVAEIINEQ
ncbi:MAG: CBS domain-containing protein [Desulfomonile tiedjei]|uniref:CBS domain-containing protein n=1 Tax=Desulfomonile tiedjei TaxID=2358 RepID=A0A9D6V2P5_9BACT|nr:CBS domain-containing protein [Desulfomonile tiedjei]